MADFLLMVVGPWDPFNWNTVGHKMNLAVKIKANCIKSSAISSFTIYIYFFFFGLTQNLFEISLKQVKDLILDWINVL